jgi:aerobic carbon-monoxide dehydrogenase medium subunit
MVALGATIVAASAKGERRIPADDFFTGLLTTDLRDDELILAVEIPKIVKGQRVAILEIARRSGDYAMAGLALSFGGAVGPRLAFFGVGDGPVRARAAEAALSGGPMNAARVAAAQAALSTDLDPPADMHGSSAMKLQLCRTLVGRAAERLSPQRKAAA